MCVGVIWVFCFKQKTAYEMRISDWSSDVCSSDLAVLLVFRLVWGFIGGEHARFANFVRPSRLLSHVRELVTGHPQRTIGHNPLGALAVLAMLIATSAVLWTGIQVDAGQADEDLHEAIAYGLLALIGVHVAAVVLMSVFTRENLARAMVTGRKSVALHPGAHDARRPAVRSEEHTSELQSLMPISYAVCCLKKKTQKHS